MTSALPLEEFHDARGDDAEAEGAQSDERAESVEGDSGLKPEKMVSRDVSRPKSGHRC